MAKKVVIGMSGGVDSSVAAYLLKKAGYDVIGVTMQIWQENETEVDEAEGGCCGLSAVDDARRVAAKLGIPYYVMNFRGEFQKEVIDYFIDEYTNGRTPNPCIACNRYVKWESLLKRSMDIGADYIATGHYARIERLENGRYAIKRSVTAAKDQTYALYNLTQEQLSKTLMPVGEFTKDQIREIAKEIQLPVAHKPDSQDICFVPDHDYVAFIEEQTGKSFPKGEFIDTDGNVIGKHNGMIHYTIGQRKGLGISLGKPAFVVDMIPEKNQVVIGDNEEVFAKGLLAEKMNFMAIPEPEIGEEVRLFAKIRYNHQGAVCSIKRIDEQYCEVIFDEPQRAITPGQAVVFYTGEYVAGGGTIVKKL